MYVEFYYVQRWVFMYNYYNYNQISYGFNRNHGARDSFMHWGGESVFSVCYLHCLRAK